MLKIGLTGSIGSGKSTTSGFFRALGVPVHDADAAVHDLYRNEAAPLIEARFASSTRDGVVDRKALAAIIAGTSAAFSDLERIVHPLVRQRETTAIEAAQERGSRFIVLDIPLLFETGAEMRCDVILVTSVAAGEQRRRVLARPGMNDALFHAILQRQMPDAEKRRRAHAIIDTGFGYAAARRDVEAFLAALAPVLR